MGSWELILILFLAFIFVGPQKLPGIAREVGKGGSVAQEKLYRLQGSHCQRS